MGEIEAYPAEKKAICYLELMKYETLFVILFSLFCSHNLRERVVHLEFYFQCNKTQKKRGVGNIFQSCFLCLFGWLQLIVF